MGYSMKTMDVNVINPFLDAVVEVLLTMAQITPEPEKPYIKRSRIAQGDITGIIGITGKDKGTIAISFSEACATTVVANMIGEKITDVDVLRDGVGELTNMVSGQARQGLAALGLKYHASIPTVHMGKNHIVQHASEGPILAIPFSTPNGPLTVEVCFGKLHV